MPSLAYDSSLRGARLIVYRDVLINLSQDSRVPPLKMTYDQSHGQIRR